MIKIQLWNQAAMGELLKADAKIFPPEDRWEETLPGYVTRPGSFVFVALDGPKIIGYVLGWILGHHPKVLHIAKLGVDLSYRKKGIGRRLVNAAILKAKRDYAAGCATLHVSTTNIPAYSLYTQLQFRAEKLVDNYYGNGKHAFKMRRRF